MVGVVEAAVFPACPVSCARAKNTSNPYAANAAGIKDALRIALYHHSLFTSRLCNAHSASRRRFFPALSSRQLSAQIHNLPYMMIRMAHRTNKNLEAIGGFRFTVGSVRLSPVRCSLFLNCRHDHGNRAVERA